jgi:3-deoxy-D-manno-octulosonic-acid transferase
MNSILMLIIYNALILLFLPFFIVFYIIRVFRCKDTFFSFVQKFGFYTLFEPFNRYDIWLHAASVGEVKSLDFIIQKNLQNGKKILITTTTIKSREIVLQYNSALIHHKFLPLDFPVFYIIFLIKNFSNKVLIAESEIWPNFILILKTFKKEVILFNARISKNSQAKWQKIPSLLKNLLKDCNIIIAQSKDSQQFLAKFHHNVKYFGNLKMLNLNFAKPEKIDEKILNFMENSRKPILCIASTHEGEDDLIIPVITQFQNKYNFIYVPRHTHRAVEISKILNKNDINHSIFSNYKNGFECLLIDQVGFLTQVLSQTKLAIYGGSFLPHLKGHNILEAANFGCKIITGPFVETFSEIIEEMKEQKAILICDINNLPQTLVESETNMEIGKNAKNFLQNSMPNIHEIWECLQK